MPARVKARDEDDWSDEAARVRRVSRAARKEQAHTPAWCATVAALADALASLLDQPAAAEDVDIVTARLRARLGQVAP